MERRDTQIKMIKEFAPVKKAEKEKPKQMPSMKKVPPVMASTLKRDSKRKVTEKMLDVP